MYCRNCGKEIADNAAVCINCGVAVGNASNYCQSCGAETNPEASVCIKCGVALKKKGVFNNISTPNLSAAANGKTKLIAALLAIFLGHLGIHQFYLGFQKKGIVKIILTVVAVVLFFLIYILGVIALLGLWVWNIIEAVNIISGKVTDADGNVLS